MRRSTSSSQNITAVCRSMRVSSFRLKLKRAIKTSFLQIVEQKFDRTKGIVHTLVKRPRQTNTQEKIFDEFSNLNSSKKKYFQ